MPSPDLTIEASLGGALRRAAADCPQRPFIRMMGGEWSYGTIDAESDRVAAGLQALGVARGDNVSLMLPNCIEFVVLWFALAKLGAVTAPVNTSFRGELLANAINLVDSRLLVVHETLLAPLAEVRASLGAIAAVVLVGERQEEGFQPYATLRAATELAPTARADVAADELCLLLYTSGSTGASKAAMIPHRFVLTHARLSSAGLGLRADDVLYCPYPLFHLDAAVMTVVPALLLRAVAAIGERFSVSRFWDEMRALRATVFDFMGATLTMLFKRPPAPGDRDHRARLGWGVPLPAWAPEFEARFGCRLVELYGLTEAGVMIYPPLDEPRRPGSCGKALGPFELLLVDEKGAEVPRGQTGELVIRPLEPSVIMHGYYGMPEVSKQALRGGRFHTGDLLRQDADGFFYFVGRSKDVVRRRGENISAAEVEMVIESHPDVLACAVIGVPSELSEEEVLACVVARPGAELQAPELWDFCGRKMARFMAPRYLRLLPALPKTPTDKVEKFRLREQGVTADTWDREQAQPARRDAAGE
ncbi:MAG: AMP-binding protein [Burkholderiaceae bacterium]|nr:AMP-binding protein [Burkholderiaceae bacterium]